MAVCKRAAITKDLNQKGLSFRSFLHESILLNQYKGTITPPKLPQLEHFNISEHGVRILDRTLTNGYSRGRIIDVYFRPEGVWCEYCQTDNCRHIQFALTIPKVREIVWRKREEGWNLPKPPPEI